MAPGMPIDALRLSVAALRASTTILSLLERDHPDGTHGYLHAVVEDAAVHPTTPLLPTLCADPSKDRGA
jgi:hypothetical protein